MADDKTIFNEPSEEAERALIDAILDKTETVTIKNSKYKIGALRKATRLKISDIIVKEEKRKSEEEDEPESLKSQKNEDIVTAKCAAAYILNSYWTLFFLGGIVWSIYWRWLYYVRQYTDSDYYELNQVCKKKAEKQTSAYTMNIILLTATRVTTMTMTRKEVKRIHLGKSMEQLGAQQKSSLS